MLEEKVEEEGRQEWKKEIEKRLESVEHKEGVGRGGIRERKEIKRILELKERKEKSSNIIIRGLQTEWGM